MNDTTAMVLPINVEHLEHGEETFEVVRPVGPWRFLTPIETVKEGDLFRVIACHDNSNSPYETGWTLVSEKSATHNKIYQSVPTFEVIRAIDDTSYTVPVFRASE